MRSSLAAPLWRQPPGRTHQPVDVADFRRGGFAIGDDEVIGQIVQRLRRAVLRQIILRRIKVIMHGEELALDQVGLHRRAHAKRQIGLALGEIEFAILEHQMHLQLGIFVQEFLQPRQQPIGAQAVAGGDLERAARGGLHILERLLGLGQAREHIRHRAIEQLAFVGQRQAARMTLKQRRRQIVFQRADLPAHRRLAQRQHLSGMREASRRRHGVEDAKLVPVHAALQEPPHRGRGAGSDPSRPDSRPSRDRRRENAPPRGPPCSPCRRPSPPDEIPCP